MAALGADFWPVSNVLSTLEPLKKAAEPMKTDLYKTELCRNWEETGVCRYGMRCHFAHGHAELRNLLRHPKYKTSPCKTYTKLGSCPYGQRCCFSHVNKASGTYMEAGIHDWTRWNGPGQVRPVSPPTRPSLGTTALWQRTGVGLHHEWGHYSWLDEISPLRLG